MQSLILPNDLSVVSFVFHVSSFIIWYALLIEKPPFVVRIQKILLGPTRGCGGGMLAIYLSIPFGSNSLKASRFQAPSSTNISLRKQFVIGLFVGDRYRFNGLTFGIQKSSQQRTKVPVLMDQHKFSFSKGHTLQSLSK